MKNKQKTYSKPQIKKIKIDNIAAIQMMSEGEIPDNPPWVKNNVETNNPYKIQKG